MSDTLNKKEIKKLSQLGKRIQLGLSCDINGHGIPCRTDRLQVVEDMIEYIMIHDYRVYVVTDVEKKKGSELPKISVAQK
jgi:hypothetical protein